MNFSKFSRNKVPEIPQQRKSGEERRQSIIAVPEERRNDEERRKLLQNFNKTIETYSKIPLFEYFSKDQLLKILRMCSKIKIPNLHFLYHAGEDSEDMYILLKGKLKIMIRTNEVWKFVTPFQSVGEMELFAGEKRSANVITDNECILLKLNKTEVSRILMEDKDLYIKLLLNVIKDLTRKIIADYNEIDELYYRIRCLE